MPIPKEERIWGGWKGPGGYEKPPKEKEPPKERKEPPFRPPDFGASARVTEKRPFALVPRAWGVPKEERIWGGQWRPPLEWPRRPLTEEERFWGRGEEMPTGAWYVTPEEFATLTPEELEKVKRWRPVGGWLSPEERFRLGGEPYREKAIAELATTFSLLPPIEIPVGLETTEEQMDWARRESRAGYFIDDYGKRLSFDEVMELSKTNPEAVITEVYFLGGGDEISNEFYAGDLYREGFGFYGEPGMRYGQDIKYGAPELIEKKRAILNNTALSYQEKLSALFGLYEDYPSQRMHSILRSEAWRSLTPEQQADLAEKQLEEPPRVERPPVPEVEPFDIEGLRGNLAPFGVSVLDVYPYLSPISPAHLGRIPQDVLERMALYLSEQGLSWNDYLALSRPFFSGERAPRGRWEIPVQR